MKCPMTNNQNNDFGDITINHICGDLPDEDKCKFCELKFDCDGDVESCQNVFYGELNEIEIEEI